MVQQGGVIRQLKDVFTEVEDEPVPLSEVGYKAHVVFLAQDYERCMGESIVLRRNKVALDRPEALESSYDRLLRKATSGEWTRVGEVAIVDSDKGKRVVALCVERGSEIGSSNERSGVA
jgi:hypothetical protein